MLIVSSAECWHFSTFYLCTVYYDEPENDTVALQALDWLKALSSFKTALAVKRLEKVYEDYASKKNEKCECLWIVVVARASLDVVMSVAASVILSLLLISGDVEENPGPGGTDDR